MSVSFVRVDDRMIHGQTVTRWSLEYPCTGLIAVNDALDQASQDREDKLGVMTQGMNIPGIM